MKILNPLAHGAIDLVTVAIFVLAPSVLGLDGAAATLSYVLAAVHLVMTLMTDGLSFAPASVIPLPLHGLIELAVGVVLGLIGWLAFDGTAQTFYLVMGLVILLVFLVTDYRPAAKS